MSLRYYLITVILLLISNSQAQTIDQTVPDVNLMTSSGQINISELKGKVIYLDFWASWCHPCRKSFPWLNKMHTKYGPQGLEVIAVNLDKERSRADQFLQLIPVSFRIAYDPEASSAKAFKVKGMPTSYLIDRDGKIRQRHTGFREKDISQLEDRLIQLLNEK